MELEILKATDKAIAAAKAEGRLTKTDAGAVAVIRALARKIDMMDVWHEILTADYESRGLKAPGHDGVSIPTYLKFCDALQLTPAARLDSKAKAKRKAGATGA